MTLINLIWYCALYGMQVKPRGYTGICFGLVACHTLLRSLLLLHFRPDI